MAHDDAEEPRYAGAKDTRDLGGAKDIRDPGMAFPEVHPSSQCELRTQLRMTMKPRGRKGAAAKKNRLAKLRSFSGQKRKVASSSSKHEAKGQG